MQEPVLVNTVSSFHCGCSTDDLSRWYSLGVYDPSQFPGVKCRLSRPPARATVYKTGRCTTNAARTPQESLLAAHSMVLRMCTELGEDARVLDFGMCNHVYKAHLGFPVAHGPLGKAHTAKTSLEILFKKCMRWRRPDARNPSTTVQLFETGKCVLAGILVHEDIAEIFQKMVRDAKPFETRTPTRAVGGKIEAAVKKQRKTRRKNQPKKTEKNNSFLG